MCTYSIKDLEHLSGIKAHTLRIWEQRYNFIHPKRTETNIRYYDDDDLKLVLNISLLKEKGYKISKIAGLSKQEIYDKVRELTEKATKYPDQIHSLILSMIEMDEERFDKIISNNILHMGFEKTITNIIYPFLSKIGILWQTGATHAAQEHFIYNLVRQKLIVAIDGKYVSSSDYAKKFFLFLPEGEHHEISLLFAHYIIKSRGNKVIYLGQGLPLKDFHLVYNDFLPDFMMTIITSSLEQHQVQKYINDMSEQFANTTILLSGYQTVAKDIVAPKNVILFNKKEDFINFVEENSYHLSSR